MNRKRRRERGFFLADVLMGILMVGMLASVLAVSLTRFHAARERLASDRTAADAAHRTLIAVRMKQIAPEIADVSIVTKDHDANWISVTATCRGRSVTLLGMASDGGGS